MLARKVRENPRLALLLGVGEMKGNESAEAATPLSPGASRTSVLCEIEAGHHLLMRETAAVIHTSDWNQGPCKSRVYIRQRTMIVQISFGERYMTYDWDGTRTRRIRNLKITVAVALPFLLIGLGTLGSGLYLPPVLG
jgi:hypothetical protein